MRLMKLFKAWFYRKGRLFPPYIYISFYLSGGIVMVAFRLIPFFQYQLKIDNALILGYLGFVMTFCGVWSIAISKSDNPTAKTNESERRL